MALLSFYFGLFSCISLLPPLSRKPLLPHLQGVCFTQRVPRSKNQTRRQLAGAGAWAIPSLPSLLLDRGFWPRFRGCRSRGGAGGQARAGAALPAWRCSAQRPGERGKKERGLESPSSLLLQQGLGLGGSFPSRGLVSYLQVLSLPPFQPLAHLSALTGQLSSLVLSGCKGDYSNM